jgi:hypothetical protein
VAALGPAFARSIWIIGPEATSSFIFRPASTFAFIGHYSEYLFFVTLIAFGALNGTHRRRDVALLGTIFAAAVVSVIFSGGRTIWFLLPVTAVAVYLVRGRPERLPPAMPLIAIAIVIALVVGLPILANRLPILTHSGYMQVELNNRNPFRPEFFSVQGLIGHGTGSALGAARYVNGGSVPLLFEGGWYELLYMFGLMGLIAYVFLYGVVLRLAWRGLRMLAGDRRWVGAAIFCYLVVIAVVDGAINYPPVNVFFWLFAGLLAGQAISQTVPAAKTTLSRESANASVTAPNS